MLARAPVRPGRWAPTRGIPLHHPHAGRTGVLCFRVTRRGAQHMGLSLRTLQVDRSAIALGEQEKNGDRGVIPVSISHTGSGLCPTYRPC